MARGRVTHPTLGTAVVIEDDEVIRSLISAVLQRTGLRVIVASNGLDGIAAVRDFDPTIVTVDIRMPGIDGIETTRRIRALSDAFIVVLSGRLADADEFESLRAGADLYMAKPFRPRELRSHIHARLRELPSA